MGHTTIDGRPGKQSPRFFLLIAAVYFYGLFATSAPANIGAVEAVVAGLLALSLAGSTLLLAGFGLERGLQGRASFDVPLPFVFAFLALGGSLWGVAWKGNDIGGAIRDVLPLGTFFLPIFVYDYLSDGNRRSVVHIRNALCFAGFAFSIRHFLSADLVGASVGTDVIVGEGAFFSNPVVIFAATFFVATSAVRLVEGRYFSFLGFFLLGACCLLPLMAVLLRSQIFLVVLAFTYTFIYGQLKNRNWLPVILLVLFMIGVFAVIGDAILAPLWELMSAKTASAGVLNDRDQEAAAVFELLGTDVWHTLFGGGWGGLIDNPAAGATVGFTHSFLMYVLFKTGLVGALLFGYYLLVGGARYVLLWASIRRHPENLPLFAAIGNTLVVNVFIEAGYKMLTFGVVLALLWAATQAEVPKFLRELNGKHN